MKTIIILDKQKKYEDIIQNLKQFQYEKIFSIDYETHKILMENKIDHILGDSMNDMDSRLHIHEESFKYINWHKGLEKKQFEFLGYDMLEMIDENEFQILLTGKLSKIFCIKKIIESENPEKIITTNSISQIIKILDYEQEIELVSETRTDEKLFFDTIEINFDSKILPKNIQLSYSRYFWLKNYIEKFITKIFNLGYDKGKKHSILFIEFNPELYEELFNEIKKAGKQSVLVNTRRSSVWNRKSIKILKKTNSKVVTFDGMLNENDKKEILEKSKILNKSFLEFFQNNTLLKKIFSIDGFSFWEIIKDEIMNMYLNKIQERLSYILISKKLHDEQKFDAIISLNLSGEAEKVFSNNDSVPTVLLQHAFGNYSKEIKSLEFTDDLHLIKDKIAVWGEVMKDYILKNYNIPRNNIIVSGSPRHDSFYINEHKKQNNNTVLLTPRPIIHDIEGENSSKYEQYENAIKKIVSSVEKNDLELIVKLHPQRNMHNEMIRNIVNSINPEIKIFQTTSIFDLLAQCSIMINLSPDNYDASTTIMEAMIMKKPIIDVSLVKKRYDFEFLKENAIYSLHFSDDIENYIMKLESDDETKEKLIASSQNHLKKYLANHGNASKILVQELSDIN